MRLLLTLLILLPLTSNAQTSADRVVKEMLNLSPRCERGDTQRLLLDVTHNYLDEDGMITQVKDGSIILTQICVGNSGSVLDYEIVVDSAFSGGMYSPGAPPTARKKVDDLDGYSYKRGLTKRMGKAGDCHDHGVELGEDLQYMSAFEFLSTVVKTQIIEQLRFTAGVRLARLGDTATLALPGPVCYSMPQAVKEYRLEQEPFYLRLAGVSSYRGRPCALVLFEAQPSRMNIAFEQAGMTGDGSVSSSGEFHVALDDGDIVSMIIRERMCAEVKLPDGTIQPNSVLTTIELRQVN